MPPITTRKYYVRALLPRFSDRSTEWVTLHYSEPDSALEVAPNVRLVRLLRSRLWKLHKFAFYQRPADAIFYPGAYWFDDLALRCRRWTCRRVPIVATLEGLAGDEMRTGFDPLAWPCGLLPPRTQEIGS